MYCKASRPGKFLLIIQNAGYPARDLANIWLFIQMFGKYLVIQLDIGYLALEISRISGICPKKVSGQNVLYMCAVLFSFR